MDTFDHNWSKWL